MEFIKSPYIPEKQAKLFLIDRNAKRFEKTLQKSLFAFESDLIQKPVSTHPDMTVCILGDDMIALEKNSYSYYKSILERYNFRVLIGKNVISSEYPSDIAMNCVIINGKLFHRLDSTDRVILEYAYQTGLKTINVKQGYTKCSTLIVNENSVITSDKSLFKAYKEEGLDVLYVTCDSIRLDGYGNGFIGGAGGMISPDTLAFFGNIKDHPDYNIISDFLKSKNISVKSLSYEPLYDYGSLIPLMT